jgi:crossover junction endodeoxyribonuclease RuvC
MRVLGIDTGYAIAGWAILDKLDEMSLVDFGVVRTSSEQKNQERLGILYTDMLQLIKEFSPDEVAIESLFYFKNQKTVINVSQARGAIILAAENSGLPVFDYTPLQVKTSLTGYGRASKSQVQEMIKSMFNLAKIPSPDDAADAVGVGVCHINSQLVYNS